MTPEMETRVLAAGEERLAIVLKVAAETRRHAATSRHAGHADGRDQRPC